jgi:hypothetical protein
VLTAALWFALAALFSRLMALAHRSPPFSRSSDRFNAAARFGPLLASIPLGIGTLVLQVWAFASRPRAIAVVIGLLAVSALLRAGHTWPADRLPALPHSLPAAHRARFPQGAPSSHRAVPGSIEVAPTRPRAGLAVLSFIAAVVALAGLLGSRSPPRG